MKPSLHLKRPGAGKRATFALLEKHPNGTYTTLRLPEIATINMLFLEKSITYEEAFTRVKNLRDRLAHRVELSVLSENLIILRKMLKGKRRPIVDPEGRERDYMNALAALGNRSILTTPIEDIQSLLAPLRPNVQRRRAQRLNEVMSFAGRGERLFLVDKDRKPITYAPMDEILAWIEERATQPCALLVGALAATGCRFGEAFALQKNYYEKKLGIIHIRQQVRENGMLGPRKNKKPYNAPVLPEFASYLAKWLDVPQTERLPLRSLKAKRLALPRGITFHDIRHSYVLHLLGKGNSLTQCARAIGDSDAVVQEHYAGFSLMDQEIESIKR